MIIKNMKEIIAAQAWSEGKYECCDNDMAMIIENMEENIATQACYCIRDCYVCQATATGKRIKP